MSSDLRAILKLEVPVIVVLGSRPIKLREVTALAPGAIVELPKNADDELELLVNNKVVGVGKAVKVGENFGLRITFIGDVRQRIAAMGGGGNSAGGPLGDSSGSGEASADEAAAAALAEQMLAGQA